MCDGLRKPDGCLKKSFFTKKTKCKVFALCFLLFKQLLKYHKKSTWNAIWKVKKTLDREHKGQT